MTLAPSEFRRGVRNFSIDLFSRTRASLELREHAFGFAGPPSCHTQLRRELLMNSLSSDRPSTFGP